MREEGLDDVPVVVGGIIPPEDAATLKGLGVAAVYTPKNFQLNAIMARHRAAGGPPRRGRLVALSRVNLRPYIGALDAPSRRGNRHGLCSRLAFVKLPRRPATLQRRTAYRNGTRANQDDALRPA